MPLMDIIKVPGITPSAALLVYAVGYTNVPQLRDRDPLDMYDSVLERLVIRSTDCRLLTKARSNDLKRRSAGCKASRRRSRSPCPPWRRSWPTSSSDERKGRR